MAAAAADSRSLGIPDLLVRECCRCSLSLKQQKQSPSFVLTELRHGPDPASIFAFPPSFSHDDWAPPPVHGHATATLNDLSLFPFLRSIGTNLPAALHAPFLRHFLHVLSTSLLSSQVLQAVADKKQVIFTGHSSGGAVAILATVWLLHHSYSGLPAASNTLCITFGSPLVGDAVFGHALRREGWDHRFLHFVSPRDIVPRALLSPLDSDFLSFLRLLSPTSSAPTIDSGYSRPQLARRIYTTATRNTAYVAGRAAIAAAGSTSLLAEALNGFVKLGPYRPAGTYAFCTDAGDFVVSGNSAAVLQLLFYSLQAGDGEDMTQLAARSFDEHFEYELRVARGLSVQKVAWLDRIDAIPLSFGDGAAGDEVTRMTHSALRALGLSTEGRLCLQAAWDQSEKLRTKNQMKVDANRDKIEKALDFLGDYRNKCELRGLGYYDSFRLQKNTEDFNANLKRLELAGLFDEIIEMLKQLELPDSYEGRREWVALGTEYRRLVEPLDIANYYRHAKNEDTGPYMIKGRPNRYRFTQRWLERADRVAAGTCSESCFWARVEELSLDHRPFGEVREAVMELERDAAAWMNAGLLGKDVLLECSTFVRWWKTLPSDYRLTASSLRKLFI